MKKGLNFHLKVLFENLDIQNVSKVEFAFARDNEKGSPILKQELYPDTVKFDEGTGAFLVPFNSIETANFPETFFMDTRVSLKNSDDQPQTPMIHLIMSDTLFE